MNSTVVAAAVFGCTLLGALTGLALHRRLPADHLDTDSKDVVKLVMGLIATVAALVLGLLISSAHRSFEAQGAEVQQIGVHLFQLDRALEHFGTDAIDARKLLQRHRRRGNRVCRDERRCRGRDQQAAAGAKGRRGRLIDEITICRPGPTHNDTCRVRRCGCFQGLADTRLLLNEQARGWLSWPFLMWCSCSG